MKTRTLFARWLLLASSLPLALASAYGWLSFLVNGIAYSDLIGLDGRAPQMSMLGHRAYAGLALGAGCEAILVSAVAWFLLPTSDSKRIRIFTSLAAGFGTAFLTLVAIKGV